MTYNKLRIGRCSTPNQVYLVTTVTSHRQPLFADLYLGRVVVREIHALAHAARSLAFVVMPDHVHWLFELQQTTTLSTTIKLFKGRTSRVLSNENGVAAPVWQASFHDHAIRTEESLVDVARYVIMNPMRAGLVERIGDYPLWDAVWL